MSLTAAEPGRAQTVSWSSAASSVWSTCVFLSAVKGVFELLSCSMKALCCSLQPFWWSFSPVMAVPAARVADFQCHSLFPTVFLDVCLCCHLLVSLSVSCVFSVLLFQHCFMMPQSLGVIGGKPNSAHYFIGYVGECPQ